MAKEPEAAPEACPVDHATRQAWLKNNGSKPAPFAAAAQEAASSSKGNSCDSSQISQPSTSPTPPSNSIFSRFIPSIFQSSNNPASPSSKSTTGSRSLGTEREISTIPRASAVDADGKAAPANSERDTGVSEGGNWVYPSEKMFFDAMRRKGYSSEAKDMQTIVPIHNAVNERAWKEIKEWERPYGSEQKCGGPKLHSFLGLSTTLSPKARFNSMLGYTPPFDRHDWVVDRCGTRVEYIIDFYAGRDEGKGNGKLNFFLDVRPKLNTWEGWKMRGFKFVGWA